MILEWGKRASQMKSRILELNLMNNKASRRNLKMMFLIASIISQISKSLKLVLSAFTKNTLKRKWKIKLVILIYTENMLVQEGTWKTMWIIWDRCCKKIKKYIRKTTIRSCLKTLYFYRKSMTKEKKSKLCRLKSGKTRKESKIFKKVEALMEML